LRQEQLARVSGISTGWFSIVIGVAVMALWLARPDHLARTAPVLFAMEFNTALCFVLSGTAACLLPARAKRVSILLSGLAALLAAAALMQPKLPLELQIDQIFIIPFVTTGTNAPGRMPVNAALCFVLINAAIMLTGILGRTSHARIILAGIAFIISATGLWGYLFSISTAQDWLPLARLSPQTAFCFLSLSTGLIFADIDRLGYQPSVVAAALAATTYLLLLVLTYVEMLRQETLLTQELAAGGYAYARSTLLAVLLLSGAAYAGLLFSAFRSSETSRRMAAQLSESQKRLAAVIETAVDGIITMDEHGTVLSVNPACETIFGYPAGGMTGQNITMLMPALHNNEPDEAAQTLAATRLAAIAGARREAEAQRRDGSTFPADVSVARIDLGHQILYSGVVRDISGRKAHERDILDANAELEEFSYRTSHDLRSPIASSLGLMSIIQDMIRQGAGLAEVQPVLMRVDQSLRKLDLLIQNIILLTRTKVMDEPDSTISVAGAVRETLDRLRQMDGSRFSIVHIDIPDTMTVRKKASRFQIILDNLLSNAVKYRDPQERTPEIFIRASSAKGRFVLSVADNGLGIPAGNEAQLFHMFKRFHPQHAQGSGLGLYILRKSVEYLGGTVAYRRLDKGSIFTVTLPEESRT
jgi:PAS domain S-box-containing protein